MDRKAKRLRLWKKNPHCYYCGIATVLYPYSGDNKEPIPDNAVTLEHLDSRYNPMRGRRRGERRIVIACHKCNQKWNSIEQATVPLPELHRRAGHPDPMICNWCDQPILSGQPTIADECGEPGERIHLDCATARDDGDAIDNEHGDS